MVLGASRRGAVAGLLLIGILGWTAVRVAASDLQAEGRRAFWKGNLREALERYRAGVRLDPTDLQTLDGERDTYLSALQSPALLESELGLSALEAGERCGRILALQVESAPLRPETWGGVAEFYGALKLENQKKRVYSLERISARPEENLEPEDILEIRALEASTTVDPNGVYYWDVLGDVAWNLGLRSLALGCYREAVTLAPDPTQHPFMNGVTLDPALAEVVVAGMVRALEPPRNAPRETVYRHLGGFFLGTGRFREAQESYRKAEAVAPAGNYASYQAWAAASQGNYQEAAALYRRSLARDRLEAEERSRIHLSLASTLINLGRYQEAAPELRNALILQPRDPRALVELGRVYERLELMADAEEQYVRAADSSTDRVTPLVALIEFYRRTGQPVQALAAARKLMEIRPGEEVYRKQVEQIQQGVLNGARP